jgi:thioredoxin-dependent peroxiredoxin
MVDPTTTSQRGDDTQTMALIVGSSAPDFTLQGWYDGIAEFSLAKRRGTPTVLAFYPGDERLICTRQLCTYSDNISDLHLFDAEVWGISPQSVESHRDFAGAKKLKMPLLTDADGAVAQAYGIVGPLGIRRSVFVIDGGGQIAWRKVTSLGVSIPSPHEIREALHALRPVA